MKMSEVFTLPLVMKESGDTFNGGVCYFENNGDQFFAERQEIEAICRAVNEYDALQAMVRELSDTLALEVSPQNDEVLCARKLLGDES